MLTISAVQAQQRLVYGTVTDIHKEPLAGVTVVVSGTNNGVITDQNGKYAIRVGDNASTLNFSMVGMEPYKVSASVGNVINVMLRSQITELDEAVVVSTGYQRISKERSTASYAMVDSAKLTTMMHQDLTSSLEGQVAGLRINVNPNTGDGSPILRGVGTFASSIGTEPLIVIDDMVTSMSLSDINPNNVESITVLKDAAASSIYGALAANGVIVITTKQAKSDKVKISLSADLYISTKPTFDAMHYASTSDIIDYETEVYNNRVATSGGYASLFSTLGNNYYSPLYQLYRDQAEGRISQGEVDATLAQWRGNDYYEQYRKYAWQSTINQRYTLSLAQKSGENNHFATFTYQKSRGRSLNDASNSFNLYAKSNYKVRPWLSARVGIEARLNRATSPNGSYTNYALQERYARIVDDQGNWVLTPYVNVGGYAGSAPNGDVVHRASEVEGAKSMGFNVLQSLDESLTRSRRTSLRPFASLEASFLKMFRYQVMYQYEWSQSRSELYDEADTYLMRLTHNAMIRTDGECLLPNGGRWFQQTNNAYHQTLRNQLNFDHGFGVEREHLVDAIVGFELRDVRTPRLIQQLMYGYNATALSSVRMDWNSLYSDGWESAIYDQTLRMAGLATSQTETHHRYASLYANAGYNLKNRYNVTGSIRWDEADLFGLDAKEQHHPLWSVGAGWNMTEEAWLRDLTWLDYLKLRATYGINGNVDQSSSTYFVARYRTLNQDPTGTSYLAFSDDDLPNPELRWERTTTTNLGVDFRVFHSHLSGSLEFYNRVGEDLLVTKYLDSTLGATSRVINNGRMRNRGVELSLTAQLLRTSDWTISASLNAAYNRNTMLHVEHKSSDVASNFITAPMNYFIQGTSYNTLWAYRLSRVSHGYPIILDAEGNEMAVVDADGNVTSVTNSYTLRETDALVKMGTLTPVYNGSLSLNLKWKGLEANALFIFSGGNKLRLDATPMDSYSINTTHILDRWTPSDAADARKVRLYTDIPTSTQEYASTFSQWWSYSDEQVRRADYIKLRSVNLAYNLPDKLCKRLSIGATRFTFQVNNLFYWSAAGRDIDPEAYSLNSGTRTLQQPRTYSFSISTSF